MINIDIKGSQILDPDIISDGEKSENGVKFLRNSSFSPTFESICSKRKTMGMPAPNRYECRGSSNIQDDKKDMPLIAK